MQPYKKLFTYWFSVLIYDRTVEFCQKWIKSWKLKEQMEGAANFLLTLCHQATFLLNRQVESLKTKHEKEGGLTEELYRKRVEFRRKNPRSEES